MHVAQGCCSVLHVRNHKTPENVMQGTAILAHACADRGRGATTTPLPGHKQAHPTNPDDRRWSLPTPLRT
eukprot:364684-Chlamydomonas_euryale.AAC.10